MRRVPHNRLIHVTDLNLDFTVDVGDGTKIPCMTIPADPDVRSHRQESSNLVAVQPLIELHRVTTNVGVSRLRHFEMTLAGQHGLAVFRGEEGFSKISFLDKGLGYKVPY